MKSDAYKKVIGITLLTLYLPILSGCITINGKTPLELVVTEVISKTSEALRSQPEIGRARKLMTEFAQQQQTSGTVSDEFLKLVESEYQTIANQITQLIRDAQTRAMTSDTLESSQRVLDKGRMKDVKIRVYRDDNVINALSRDTLFDPTIEIPSGFIIQTLKRLLPEPDDAEDFFASAFNSSLKYIPFIEFEEIMRFIVAHELTHIWLHKPGLPVREREIEADAWAVILAGELSPALRAKAKAGTLAMHGGFQSRDPYSISLLHARTGAEVLLYLYEKDGIFSAVAERETFSERKSSIEAKISEVQHEYASTVSTWDLILFRVMNSI